MNILIFYLAMIIFCALPLASLEPTITYPVKSYYSTETLNWAGYAVTSPQENVTSVVGSWQVPLVNSTATPNAYSAFWVGIDGYSSNTVEQTGTESDSFNGVPYYAAWYEIFPADSIRIAMSIQPCDFMSAEVRYVGSDSFLLQINDTTTGEAFSITQTLPNASRSSAEWIAEAPVSGGFILPLADFGTIRFSSAYATLNGHTGAISDSAWQYDTTTMVALQYDETTGEIFQGATQAQPSPLSNGGESFSVTWHSPAAPNDSDQTKTSVATKYNQQAISIITSDARQFWYGKDNIARQKVQSAKRVRA
jgi:hypothetical protein